MKVSIYMVAFTYLAGLATGWFIKEGKRHRKAQARWEEMQERWAAMAREQIASAGKDQR